VSLTRNLGLTALGLGAAAPFAGSPYAAPATTHVDKLAKAITDGDDHVSALQLAAWIKARKPGLRVIDVRSSEDFKAFSLPTAETIPLSQLSRARFAKGDTVVLYSEGGAHAGQAWVLLRLMGVTDAYFIAGGLADWRDEVMTPNLPAGASPDMVKAFAPVAELSAYFGGTPQTGPVGSSPTQMTASHAPAVTAAADLAALRRRGC
jgi:rhodanese-related sulfurtransferase